MKVFTKIKDVDLKILQQLDDKDLPLVCSVNKYVAQLCNDENFWLTRLLNKQVYPLEEIRDFKGNFTYKEIYRHLFLNEYEQGMFEAAKRNNVYYFHVVSRGHFDDKHTEKFQQAIKYNSFDILNYFFIHAKDTYEKRYLGNEIYLSRNEKAVIWYIKMGLGNYKYYIIQLTTYRAEFADYVYEQFKKYLPYIKCENIKIFKEIGANLGGAIPVFTEDENIQTLQKLQKITDLFLQHVRKEEKQIIIQEILSITEDWEDSVDEKLFKTWQKFLEEKM